MSKTLLPPNATPLELALEGSVSTAFDHPVAVDRLWSADNCPIELLPFLAWALSVDTWDADWPERVKRQVIASSVEVHRLKGTAAGIKTALAALDLGVTISEWFEHGGEPYTFRADVRISTRGLTDREYQNIVDVISATKNARSHLSRLRVYLTSNAIVYFGGASVTGERVDVYPWFANVPPTVARLSLVASTQIAETVSTGESHV